MTFDKTIAAMLLVPVIGLVIPAAIYFRKFPGIGLSPSEKYLMTFSSQPLSIFQPGNMAAYSGLECPLRPSVISKNTAAKTNAASFPPGPIPPQNAAMSPLKVRPVTRGLPGVSMIYSDGQTHMAIIDGHVLREGAPLAGGVVVKIEKTRVLLRTTGKDVWLYTN